MDLEAIAKVHVLSWQHAYRQLLPQEFLASLSIEQRRTMWAKSFSEHAPREQRLRRGS